MKDLTDRIVAGGELSDDEWRFLIEGDYDRQLLYDEADKVRRQYYGAEVYIRGLIEISSFCKNDCLYCGIRRSNGNAERYRLSKEDILACCEQGYGLGFRTFVLQGGEDSFHTTEWIADLVSAIKEKYPDCAVTLSLGERPRKDYEIWYQAGADRYLLRHETASCSHYGKLHPPGQTFAQRMECLRNLRQIGYQTGAGFMVGSPFQKTEDLIADMPQGSLERTLTMVALTRLILPKTLLPATTALGTIHPQGREMGLKAGANVIMPNLSPAAVRGQYSLYDNKLCTGEEAAEGMESLKRRVSEAGYRIAVGRGDSLTVEPG